MGIGRRSRAETGGNNALRRFVPLAVVLLAMVVVFASGAHRHLSLETLVQHRMAIDAFIDRHMVTALAVFVVTYIVVVALSIPGALFLTGVERITVTAHQLWGSGTDDVRHAPR